MDFIYSKNMILKYQKSDNVITPYKTTLLLVSKINNYFTSHHLMIILLL